MKYLVNRETKKHRLFTYGAKIKFGVDFPECAWDVVKADSEGWIPWDGGECPLPDGAGHEVKFLDGDIEEDESPETWQWGNDGSSGDIIAYRPILSEQSEPDAKQSLTVDLLTRLRVAQEASKDFDAALEELSEQLCELGYQLVPITPEVALEVPSEDMSDWRNWREGDKIQCISSKGWEDTFVSGAVYTITSRWAGGIDLDSRPVALSGFADDFKFHSRPKVQS